MQVAIRCDENVYDRVQPVGFYQMLSFVWSTMCHDVSDELAASFYYLLLACSRANELTSYNQASKQGIESSLAVNNTESE